MGIIFKLEKKGHDPRYIEWDTEARCPNDSGMRRDDFAAWCQGTSGIDQSGRIARASRTGSSSEVGVSLSCVLENFRWASAFSAEDLEHMQVHPQAVGISLDDLWSLYVDIPDEEVAREDRENENLEFDDDLSQALSDFKPDDASQSSSEAAQASQAQPRPDADAFLADALGRGGPRRVVMNEPEPDVVNNVLRLIPNRDNTDASAGPAQDAGQVFEPVPAVVNFLSDALERAMSGKIRRCALIESPTEAILRSRVFHFEGSWHALELAALLEQSALELRLAVYGHSPSQKDNP